MRILHIVGGLISGGAARGALWLHRGLRAISVDSHLLVQSGRPTSEIESLETSRYQRRKQWFLSEVDRTLPSLYTSRRPEIFSSALIGNDLLALDAYKKADIIHLHWINAGAVSTRTIGKIRKPIVWTLRDMWPFTGGCHIYSGCDRFHVSCGSCPLLNSHADLDLSRLVHWMKQRNFGHNIHPVAISRWLADHAASSSLFSSLSVQTIHNSIDTAVFRPLEKRVARELLDLPNDRTIVLSGATQLNEPRKGLSRLVAAGSELDSSAYFFVFFGQPPRQGLPDGFPPHRFLGVLHDQIALSVVYSAADVFVAPYANEPFGKTLVEAMACETPVVCFDQAGPAEIVVHEITGFKARPFSESDFARGIVWLASNPRRHDIGIAARKRAQEHFGIEQAARSYAALYSSII